MHHSRCPSHARQLQHISLHVRSASNSSAHHGYLRLRRAPSRRRSGVTKDQNLSETVALIDVMTSTIEDSRCCCDGQSTSRCASPSWLLPHSHADVVASARSVISTWGMSGHHLLMAIDANWLSAHHRPLTNVLKATRAARIEDIDVRVSYLAAYFNLCFCAEYHLHEPFAQMDPPEWWESDLHDVQDLGHSAPCAWCLCPVGTAPCSQECGFHVCEECASEFQVCRGCHPSSMANERHRSFLRPFSRLRNLPFIPALLTRPSFAGSHVIWSASVPSSLNLRHFQDWTISQPLSIQAAYLTLVYAVGHLGARPPDAHVRLSDGSARRIRVVSCEESECSKCRQRQGGLEFGWEGPWTCFYAKTASSVPTNVTQGQVIWCTLHSLCPACRQRHLPASAFEQPVILETVQRFLPAAVDVTHHIDHVASPDAAGGDDFLINE